MFFGVQLDLDYVLFFCNTLESLLFWFTAKRFFDNFDESVKLTDAKNPKSRIFDYVFWGATGFELCLIFL